MLCNGQCNGSASLTVTGGQAPYTYAWAPSGGNASTATGLCAGTYTATVTDAAGCTTTHSVTITQPPALTTTQSQVNILCNSVCNGSATVTASGGTAPYSYYSAPSRGNAATATGPFAGNYTVTVTDANGCTRTATYNITQPQALTTTQSQVNILCNGVCNGSATVVASGGTAPYTYAWAPSGGNAATANGLCAGTYTVTVTDANGCTRTATYTITQPPALTVTSAQTNINCFGNCNGTATITASGGTAPYTYAWAPSGGNAATATGLCAGTYTATVTDANGCTRTATYTITQPPALTSTQSQNNILCNNTCTGSATVTPSGGTAPYTYAWSPSGGTGASATGLCAGNYTVTITDANGCTRTATYSITQPPALTLATSVTPATCNQNNGSASVNASGGSPAYTYAWAPSGGNAANATGLGPGTYTVTVTDANGCTATATATVVSFASPVAAIASSANVTCFNLCNGSATASVTGGTGPFSYNWAPSGGNSTNATGLCAGTYTFTVTDANNCTSSATVTITQPAQLTLQTAGFPATCFGMCNGQAVTIPAGGTQPYSYNWAPSGGNNPSATGLCAGTYTVTVTDANGCTITGTATVTEPPALAGTTSAVTSNCNQPDGQACVNMSGGSPPYSYLWTPSAQTGNCANNLTPGQYCVTVTDANGCTFSTCVTVPNAPGVTATMGASSDATCFNACDGSATVNASGGVGPYTYAWAPSGGNAATANGLCAGTYTVTVTDASGCTSTATVTINQPQQLAVTSTNPAPICIGQCATLVANVTGGTPAYNITWAPAGPNVCPTVTTTYTVTVTDANGCTATPATVTVTVNPPLAVSASANPTAICVGASSQLSATGSGGSGTGYTYTWTPGNLNGQNVNVSPTATTTYTVTLSDNCNSPTVTATVTITVNPAPVVAFVVDNNAGCAPLCVNFTDQTNGASQWNWSFQGGAPATSTSQNPGPICFNLPGSYNVSLSVVDNNGCSSTTVINQMITVHPNPQAGFTPSADSISILNPTICFTSTASGASTYFWDFGDPGDQFNNSTQTNPCHTYSDTGLYCIKQVVATQYGCTDSVTYCVWVMPDFTFYAPNAFTPNGDGINDLFFPLGEGIDPNKFEMWIFDRWGNNIFYTQRWGEGWDGKANGGAKIAQEDVYVWKCVVYDFLGKKHSYIGHVSLIK